MDRDDSSEKNLTAKDLVAFFALTVGMFMAILDIQIVSSSLSVIAAGLNASGDELSWIQTSYLIAEVIIIPITGFACRALSTRTAYFIASVGFTFMSALCAFAWNIEAMIIFRAFQGLFGGAMIPVAFGSVFIIFPARMRAKVTMIIGLVVTVAPTIGPTLGGYITEILSWEFMFLINVIPGIFVSTVVFFFLDFDKPNYKLFNNLDFIGIILLAFTLGSLEYVLEEGNKKDWLESTLLLCLTISIIITSIILIRRELTFANPIIDLKSFQNKNFTFGCIYSFILGTGLFGTVYLLPLFLFTVAGYNTLQIGVTMMVTGLFQFVSAPMAAKMFEAGVDKRIIMAIGFISFGTGSYLNSFLTADSGYWEFFIPQTIRGLSLMFCFMPINDLALGTISKDQVQNASGLYNLTRNLGGAIGLALINSMIISKSRTYTQAIKENIPMTAPLALEQMDYFKGLLFGKVNDTDTATFMLLSDILARESFIMAINNIFIAISCLFFCGLLLLPFTSNVTNNSDKHAH